MPRYVFLVNWTDQGIRNAKGTVERSSGIRQMFQDAGAQVLDLYWTLGPYDLVAITEAPDDETITRLALTLGGAGNVRTLTMRAFGEQEMSRIVQQLP